MKKKLLVLTVGAGLSIALLSGCGTPSAKKIVDGMYDVKIESANVNVYYDLDISGKVDGNKSSVKATVDMDIAVDGIDTPQDMIAYAKGDVKYDLLGMLNDKQSVEAYVETDEDESTVYMYDSNNKEWTKTTEEMPEEVEVDEKVVAATKDAAKEIWYKGTVEKKTEKVEDEECYVISLKTTLNDYIPALEKVLEASDEDAKEDFEDAIKDLEDELDIEAKELFDCIVIDTKAYVSKKNKYMVACDMDFAGIDLDKAMDLFDVSWEDLGSLMGTEIEGVSINSFYLSFTLSDINNTEVELSKDAKNAEEKTLGFGMDGLIGGSDDYTIDEDGDDADWDFDDDEIVDDDDDEIVDDEDDDDSYELSDCEYYDQETGNFQVLDGSEKLIMEMASPSDYDISYASTTGSFYTFLNKNYDSVTVKTYADSSVVSMVDKGEDDGYFEGLWTEAEDVTLGDYDCKLVKWGYDSEYTDTTKYELWIPYVDSYGYDEYVVIELGYESASWKKNDLISLFEEMLVVE